MEKNVTELNDLFRQVAITQQRTLTTNLKNEVGLTTQQTQALGFIQDHPGIIQRELADKFHRRSASISNLLQILERDGYIERRIPANSGRSKQIFLTAKGTTAIHGFRTYFDSVENQMVANLSASEQVTLIALLKKVIAAYD